MVDMNLRRTPSDHERSRYLVCRPPLRKQSNYFLLAGRQELGFLVVHVAESMKASRSPELAIMARIHESDKDLD